MPKVTTNEGDLLEFHVLGSGIGESIVLGWPNNRWGVIDCYASSLSDPKSNATLEFLTHRNVSCLEFLCLTHPHDDHFRGMSQLLEKLTVKYFWRFPTCPPGTLVKLAKYFAVDANRSGVKGQSESSNDFIRIMKLVEDERKNNNLKQKMVNENQQLYPVPFDPNATFQIRSFAPPGNKVAEYESKLVRSFDKNGKLLEPPPSISHNDISVGLIVNFGKTRILLCGDIEKASWEMIWEDGTFSECEVDVVKVSHHGSPTGYFPELWRKVATKKKPIAIVTPFRRFGLPTVETLEEINTYASKIILTSDPATNSKKTPNIKMQTWLALKSRMNAQIINDQNGGTCSLYFNSKGQCLEEKITGNGKRYEQLTLPSTGVVSASTKPTGQG